MPKEDGSYEYGSSRWATKKEIKKEFKIWNIGSKLSSGGIPVTFMDGKYYYYDSECNIKYEDIMNIKSIVIDNFCQK